MQSLKRSSRRESHGSNQSARRPKEDPSKAPPKLYLIVSDQAIIDKMDQDGIKPTPVKLRRETYYNAYPVTDQEARHWCEVCREALCRCADKFSAPILLTRQQVGTKGAHVVALRRKELPIHIPKRKAAA